MSAVVLVTKLVPSVQLAISAQSILVVCICFAVAAICSVLLWAQLARGAADVVVSYADATVGLAVMLAGKYMPGRAAGVAARVVHASGATGIAKGIVAASAEQLAVVSAILFLTGFAPLVSKQFPIWLLACLPASLIFLLPVPSRWLQCLACRWRRVGGLLAGIGGLSVPIRLRVLLLGIGVALASVAPALIVADLLLFDLEIDGRVTLLFCYLISVLVGMAAIVVPAGLGVREASLVVLISETVPTEVAVAVAVVLRLISIVYDLLVGVVATTIIGWAARSR